MGASQSLSKIQFPYQQPMFLPAEKIAREAILTDQESGEWASDTMERKLRESKEPSPPLGVASHHGQGVYDSVKAEGVKTPIEMGLVDDVYGDGYYAQLYNGHHRVASAAALGLEIPIRWDPHIVADIYPSRSS